jgi:hypothetical protein
MSRMSRTTLKMLAAGCVLAAAACNTRDITTINDNPNAPTKVTPQLLFPNGVTDIVGRARGGSMDLTFLELWAQHIAMDRFTDEDHYSLRVDNITGYWSGFYSGGLEDLATILQQNTAADKPNIVAPALVMKSWTYGIMTDVWGDLPYSKANTGDVSAPPAYDTQQQIYAGLFADLKQAADIAGTTGTVTSAAASYGTADLIYGGDMTKWKKLANSLRLRYALRLSKVDAATAATQVAAAVAAGVMTSNADNALLKWPGDGTNDSPYFTTFRTRDDQHVSETLINTLKGLYVSISAAGDTTFDPRLAIYADPIQSSPSKAKYVGMPNGLVEEDANAIPLTNTSRVGATLRARTSPSILMRYDEVLFDEAEAALRGWIPGDPAALYRAGITASMQYYGIPDATISAYLATPRVAYAAATAMQQIALQRWIALYNEGSEAYSEWRRTGVPALKAGPGAITSPREVARRSLYPSSEQSFNNANLQAAIAHQGNVGLLGRVWWDKP